MAIFALATLTMVLLAMAELPYCAPTNRAQVTDAGCAILMSALNRDHLVMPALERVLMVGSAASAAMRVAVREALLARERARRQRSVDVSRRV